MKLKDARELAQALTEVVQKAEAFGLGDDDQVDVLATMKAIGEEASADLEAAIAEARQS